MRTPDPKPGPEPKAVGDAKARIGRALTRAYEPIVEEPVPPTLAKIAERLDPPGSEGPAPSFLDRAGRALRTVLGLGGGRRSR